MVFVSAMYSVLDVIVIMFTLRVTHCIPTWTFHTNQITFGRNLDLKCTLANVSSIPSTIGPVDVKVLDGEPVTDSKKLEMAHKMYSLSIKSFTNDGKAIPYDCQLGSQNSGNTLNLTVENFIYSPKPSVVSYTNIEEKGDLFTLKFHNIDQPPKCTVSYGNINMTDKLQTNLTRNESLYDATIYVPNTQNRDSIQCLHSLKVSCDIGTKVINHKVETMSSGCHRIAAAQVVQETEEKDQSLGIFGLVVFSIVALVYVGGFIIAVIVIKRKEKK